MVRSVVVAGCFGVSACVLLTDTSGLSTGAIGTGAEPSDAAPSGADGGGGEASAANVRFCERAAHTFCADFDRPSLLEEGWTTAAVTSGELLPSPRPLSPPGALLVKLPRRDTRQLQQIVVKDFVRPWQRVIVEHDLFLEAPDFLSGDSTAGLFCADFFAGDVLEGGLCVGRGRDLTAATIDGPPFAANEWIHARYDIDPSTKSAMVKIGDVVLTPTFDLSNGTGEPRISVMFGVLGYNVPSPAFAVHLDNITIDLP